MAQAPRAARRKGLAQGVGVVSAIRQQNVAAADGTKHVFGAAPVMGLTFSELEKDRQATGIDESVDPRLRGDKLWSSARRASDPCNGIAFLFFTVSGMLMNANGRGINHLNVAVISL